MRPGFRIAMQASFVVLFDLLAVCYIELAAHEANLRVFRSILAGLLLLLGAKETIALVRLIRRRGQW